MQSLTSRASQSVASSRIAARQSSRARPVAVSSSSRSQHRLTRYVAVKAAEEATATAEPVTEASTSDGEANGREEQLTALQRARRALEAGDVDKATLEAALADLDAEMAKMQDTVAAAESRAATLENSIATAKDQLLRLNADFENFRRRAKEEKDSLADSVRGDVIQQLLPLVDNFELARTQVKAETEAEQKINNSYQSLYKQMVDIMRGLGIEAVPTTGSPFDPEVHEAIMREPNDEVADGTVLQEFRKGFRLGSKLLRPAMVKVSVNEGGAPVPSSEE